MKGWVTAIEDREDLNLVQLRAMQRVCERLMRNALRPPGSRDQLDIALFNRELFSAELLDLVIRTGLDIAAAKEAKEAKEARKARCARHCGRQPITE